MLRFVEKPPGDQHLFNHESLAAIIVTDIDTEETGIESGLKDLNTNLQLLSEKEVSVYDLCNKAIQKRMEDIPSEFNKYYVCCRDFDKLMREL